MTPTSTPQVRSSLVKAHQPCPCGESSDAFSWFSDGHGYCYSAVCLNPYYRGSNVTIDTNIYTDYIPLRGISRDTLSFFEVKTRIKDDTPFEIVFPYERGAKVRSLSNKAFRSEGDMHGGQLFGKEKFNAGSATTITITEGEFDALAVFEMMGNYPVVSVRSASSAFVDCTADLKYLDSFDEIKLCFDNDEPGQKAAKAVASLFNFEKVKIVPLTKYKDANEYLEKGESKAFRSAWWSAKRFMRDDIISTYTEIEQALREKENKPALAFPWSPIQEYTWGARYGDFVLFTAQEGIGKTEVFRALEYSWLKETDINIGVIHLEESKDRSIEGLVGYELNVPVHLPTANVSLEEKLAAYKALTKKEDRLHIYTHFGSGDPDDLLGAVRFLGSACNCKAIFLDHITMIVTGHDDMDERKTLDYLSTQLKMLAKELDFIMVVVSHENDEGKTRGSRNISKVADLHVQLTRNKLSPSEDERNTTYLTIHKNRFGSITGPAGALWFEKETFKIGEKPDFTMPPVEVENGTS